MSDSNKGIVVLVKNIESKATIKEITETEDVYKNYRKDGELINIEVTLEDGSDINFDPEEEVNKYIRINGIWFKLIEKENQKPLDEIWDKL